MKEEENRLVCAGHMLRVRNFRVGYLVLMSFEFSERAVLLLPNRQQNTGNYSANQNASVRSCSIAMYNASAEHPINVIRGMDVLINAVVAQITTS